MALYIIPVDQIVSAVHPGIARAVQHIQDTRDRLALNTNIPPSVLARIDGQLADVQYRLLALPVNF